MSLTTKGPAAEQGLSSLMSFLCRILHTDLVQQVVKKGDGFIFATAMPSG